MSQTTIIGNMASEPELKFTPSGAGLVNFTVASTPRQFDKQQDKWVDGDTLFMRCTAWRDLAENIADGLVKGQRVIAHGRLKQREFETRQGEKRSVVELEVEDIGVSLRFRKKQQQAQASSSGDGVAPPW